MEERHIFSWMARFNCREAFLLSWMNEIPSLEFFDWKNTFSPKSPNLITAEHLHCLKGMDLQV